MNKRLFSNLVALLLLALGTLSSVQAQSNCNNKLIAGYYGFTVQGTKLSGTGPTGPMVGVAMTKFDGKGGLSQIDTVTIDGDVIADFTHKRAKGTYSVNPDCTGTFTIDFTDERPPVAVNFVVVADGDEIDTVVISAGGQQGILATGSIGKRRSTRTGSPGLHQ